MNLNVFNEDCLTYMKTMESDSINTIVTSPPYNKNDRRPDKRSHVIWKTSIEYDSYSDDMNYDDYVSWQLDVLNECYRILKPDGSMFYNHKVIRKNGEAIFPKFVFDSDFKFYQLIYWDRGNCPDVRQLYLYPTTELIFWLCKDKPKVHKSDAIYKSEVWRFPPTKSSEDKHPASFPIELPYNCILLTTDTGDTVFDPFAGSGTTGLACKKLARNFIGTEISPTYASWANDRLLGESTHSFAKFGKRLFSPK